MDWIDTHAHLYSEDFQGETDAMVQRAKNLGVSRVILPNIDLASIDPMETLCCQFPDFCYPTLGLHPTAVRADYSSILRRMEKKLSEEKYLAIGEAGLDFYWDTSFSEEQEKALLIQMDWAKNIRLPLILHSRKSLDQMIGWIKKNQNGNLKGVFHCFPGNSEQARRVIDLGFHLGIGGVVTFRNAGLAEVVKNIPLEFLLLETDAPYLAPDPYRGKRNESSYIPLIGQKISFLRNIPESEVSKVTTLSAMRLFFKEYSQLTSF